MLTRRRFTAAFAATASLSFLASARAATVTDASGTAVETGLAKRVVTIGSDVTETVFALGEGHRVVAADSTSRYPAEVTRLPNVGYMRALSPEGVLSMAPDLILVNQGAGPAEAIAALRQSGVPLAMISGDPAASAVGGKVRLIGNLLGAEGRAEALAASVEMQFSRLALAIAKVEHRPRTLFLLGLSAGRIVAAGQPSAASAIIDLAGARNAIEGFHGFKPIGEETVLSAQPEAILLMDSGNHAMERDKLLTELPFSATPAARDKRILLVDGSLLLSFGPRAPAAARDLAMGLHPGLTLPPIDG